MHILQPKHSKIPEKRAEELLKELNVSKSQLPKILWTDPALPEGCQVGDIIQIERKEKSDKEEEKTHIFWRVVV